MKKSPEACYDGTGVAVAHVLAAEWCPRGWKLGGHRLGSSAAANG